MLRQVSTNSLAHSPVVHKKLSLVRGELAHQFCQNLSFPLSMMQKFWLSECDTDLLYGSGVCRFRKADRQRQLKCELPNIPVLASCWKWTTWGMRWEKAADFCWGGLAPSCVLCSVPPCQSVLSLSVSLLHTQVTDLQIHPNCLKYPRGSSTGEDISDYNINLWAGHPFLFDGVSSGRF